MTSSPADPSTVHSLLSPVVAGTPVEALTDDRALLGAMVGVEGALAGALTDVGLVAANAAEVVAAVCGRAADELAGPAYLADLAMRATTGGNPVIALVADLRARVAEVDADAASALHHGATSQDILDTALMLLCRQTLDRIAADLRDAATHAARLAEAHRATPACGRTLTQQAMPTTFGFRVAGWLAGLRDATDRVEAVAAALPVQLGGPVGTTSAYAARGPQVVEAFAARLGLSTPLLSWHTRRTPVVDVGHALVVACGAMGKIAADVLVLAQTEVGEVAEASGGGSSSMAHKENPTQSVLVASAARQVPALVGVLGASMAAEQERSAGAWHAEWEPLRQALRLTGAAAHRGAQLLAGLQVDRDAMQRNVDHLVASAGLDADTLAASQVAAGVWVDRILADCSPGPV